MIKNISLSGSGRPGSVTFNGTVYDGYDGTFPPLLSADGYSFTTKWVDLEVCPMYSISVVFAGGSPVGSLQLEQSNDFPYAQDQRFPDSCVTTTTLASQDACVSNAIDTLQVVGSVQAVNAGTIALSGGVFAWESGPDIASPRWVRVVYTASVDSDTVVTIRLMARSFS